MTRIPCKRSWAAEALEDRRLEDKDRSSFERHAETCEDCARALAHVRELGKVLAGLPASESNEFDRRRARADLLARANARMVGGERRSKRWALLALAPALAAVALVVVHRSAPVSPAVASVLAPMFEVADVDHADFDSERSETLSRVVLRSGTASFHVEHVKSGARFLVALPDGEVEVRGTRFVVDVSGGHTRSVAVTEGFVAVRVGAFTGLLHAGERWPAQEASTIAPAPPFLPVAATPVAPPVVALRAAAVGAGPRFAEAMAAFDAGDYGEADRLFVTFVRDFPSDTRAEDALFLLADARARRGDMGGAREAAREYLRRFPAGLRAPAAGRLAADPSHAP